jgi:hypothetical protein
MARMRRKVASLSFALAVVVASGVSVLIATELPAGAFTPGEGAGKTWCAAYGGKNIGSYRGIYACRPDKTGAGKTPFDSFSGFQPTELANRFLYRMTGHTLFDNEVAGNFVALASATYAIPDAAAGAPGVVPAPGDIISMWGGRSEQKQNGDRTLVAVVTQVAPNSSGWTISTLNQGEQADASGANGFDTITVSDGGRDWSTERGFYGDFDWLRLTAGTRPSGGRSGSGHAGLGWTAAPVPAPATQSGQLLSVACGSATSCTAVGTSGQAGILLSRTRQTWARSAVPVPATAASAVSLAAVTCPAATACVIGGHYRTAAGQQGLLLTGSGAAWTATTAPLPLTAAANPDASVAALSCATSVSCVAVGQYAGASSAYPLLLTGHGSSWSAQQAPLPADAARKPAAGLVSVACPSATVCTAVGSYIDTSGNRQGMLVTEHGTSWTATRSPLPASAVLPGASLSAVACPQPGQCVAVGSFSRQTRGFVVSGSGTSWTAAQTPLPAGAAATQAASFRAVACSSASSCVAAGSYTDTSGSSQGLLVTWHDPGLTALTAALPAGAAPRQGQPGAGLTSVACSSASSCVAGGGYTDTTGDAQVLLLTSSGSAWTPLRAPVPANARTVGSQAQGAVGPPTLTSVACPAVSACVAVGSYPTRKVGTAGLLIVGSS